MYDCSKDENNNNKSFIKNYNNQSQYDNLIFNNKDRKLKRNLKIVYNRILVDIKTGYYYGNQDEILFKIHEYISKENSQLSAPSTTTGSPTTHAASSTQLFHAASSTTTGPSTTHAASSTTTGPPTTHAAPSITTGPHATPLN
ncbi:hypothetical protein ACTFIW_010701 [Dictyostelium discoideum]